MTRNDFISQLARGFKDFSSADLHGVDFSYLELEGLNFKGANLSGCNFWITSLSRCNLENADLSCAKIGYKTVLYNVNLTNVCLNNTIFNFDKCVFKAIEIDTKTMDKYFPSVCPSDGEFIGWKKAFSCNKEALIVKLLIPKDARRGSSFRRKCRCDKAKVLGIEQLHKAPPESIFGDNPYGSGIICAYSIYDRQFKYELGKEVSVDNFDEDRRHECAPGIHFFMTREEAVNY